MSKEKNTIKGIVMKEKNVPVQENANKYVLEEKKKKIEMMERHKKEIEMMEQQFLAQLDGVNKQYEFQLENIKRMQENNMRMTRERHNMQLNTMNRVSIPDQIVQNKPLN